MRRSVLATVVVLLLTLVACRRDPERSAVTTTDARVTTERGAEPTTVTATDVPVPSDVDTEHARVLRELLVDRLARGGIVNDARVLQVLRDVPRHAFAPNLTLGEAYFDAPQPIGHDQTISQPTVVGEMTQALELTGHERVLEIGTGSGYQAAVLARLAKEVYTIEIVAPLGEQARARLARLGYTNVHVRIGDGYKGWPESAPFDRILVTAAPEKVPPALVAQLAEGGILVAPVGPTDHQDLVRMRKVDGGVRTETLAPVRFVPMIHGP
jgi:protein-L-isoaspartate(D-aspartate) O-methyltransferase